MKQIIRIVAYANWGYHLYKYHNLRMPSSEYWKYVIASLILLGVAELVSLRKEKTNGYNLHK